ncbi:MAG: AsmA family protein [Xanthobacteraceae bacterium]
MQTTLLTIGIALILALVTALVGPLFVDWARFRTDFEARASRIAGQPVQITGAIDVRLLPIPTVRLQGINVGPADATPALGAREIDAELSLASLMRGELRATVVRIDAPYVSVERDRDGRVSGPAVVAGGEVTIDRIAVSDGRVSLADTSSGAKAVLDNVSFKGEIRAPVGPIRGAGAFVIEGQSFNYRIATSRGATDGAKLSLAIDPSDRPLTIETEGVLTFADDMPHYDGSLVLTRPAGLALSSGKTITSDPWRIESKLKIDTALALFEQVDFQYGPDERAVRLTGTAELKFGAGARLNSVLSARQIDLDRALAATDTASRHPLAALRHWSQTLDDILHPPMPLTIGIGIDAVTLGGATLQSVRADLRAERDGLTIDSLEFRAPGFTQVGLSGRLDAASWEFAGPVTLNVPDPTTLIAWLDGVDLANRTLAAFRMRGDVALGRKHIAFDRVKAEYDHGAFEGSLGYRFANSKEPARLDVGLTAAAFNLDNAISLASAALAGANASGTAFERPGEIALAVDLGRVTFAGVDAKNAKANVTFDGTGLRIAALSIADFGGAAITASGGIEAPSGSPRGTVTLGLDARKVDGLAALAAIVSPKAADLLRANASRMVPAKLEAAFKVEPAPAGVTQSLAQLKLDGTMGGVEVNLAAQGLGNVGAVEQADLRIDSRIASDDGALLAALGLDWIAGEKRGAKLAWTASGSAGGDFKVDATLTGDGVDAAAAGTLRLADFGVRGNADVSLSARDLRWLRRATPFPVALKTRVAINGNEIGFRDLIGDAGGAAVRAQGHVVLGQPVRLEASLATDRIDIPALVAATIGMPTPGANDATWSAQPFRSLAQISARVALEAEQATLAPAVIANKLRGALALTPQDVAFETVTASIGGGTLSADAGFRSGTGGLTVRTRMALTNADATAVIHGSGQPPVIGRLSSKLELEGSGTNPAALIGSLNGTGSVTLEGAQIAGLDPKAIDVAIRAIDRGASVAPARIGDMVARVMDAGSLSMPWVSAPLAISAGRVRLGKLVVPPQSNDLAANGTLDLLDSTIDARFTLFGAAETGQRPQASVLLKGPIATPRRTIDVSALTSWLTLQSVDRETRRLDAVERASKQPDGAVAPPAPAPTGAGQGDAQAGTKVGANPGVSPPQPRVAPALPPPVVINRLPGISTGPRAMPALPTSPLLTPQ